MSLKGFYDNKLMVISASALLCVAPYFAWKALFQTYNKLRRECESKILHYQRHNCVVTYQPNKGICGWPPHTSRTNPVLKKYLLDGLYEPILYFISTARKTLDIAVMMLNVKQIYQELLTAKRKGVKIRLLLNFSHVESSKNEIRHLMLQGIEVQFFVSPTPDLSSIMHYKYIVKDYTNADGYLCIGSMNFTNSSFLYNFDSFVLTSNYYVVEAFHTNFEECWQNVKFDNECLINKTILTDAQLQ